MKRRDFLKMVGVSPILAALPQRVVEEQKLNELPAEELESIYREVNGSKLIRVTADEDIKAGQLVKWVPGKRLHVVPIKGSLGAEALKSRFVAGGASQGAGRGDKVWVTVYGVIQKI